MPCPKRGSMRIGDREVFKVEDTEGRSGILAVATVEECTALKLDIAQRPCPRVRVIPDLTLQRDITAWQGQAPRSRADQRGGWRGAQPLSRNASAAVFHRASEEGQLALRRARARRSRSGNQRRARRAARRR